MDSLIQQVKAQPIVKETNVDNNKKIKIAKPSKFEAMFKEMKVSEEYTKKPKHKFGHFKDNTFPQKVTTFRQIYSCFPSKKKITAIC